jgi:hypothetical protein
MPEQFFGMRRGGAKKGEMASAAAFAGASLADAELVQIFRKNRGFSSFHVVNLCGELLFGREIHAVNLWPCGVVDLCLRSSGFHHFIEL